MLRTLKQNRAVYKQRVSEYFVGAVNIDQVLGARSAFMETESNLTSNLYSTQNRELRLMQTTGQIYDMVGLKVTSNSQDFSRPSSSPEK